MTPKKPPLNELDCCDIIKIKNCFRKRVFRLVHEGYVRLKEQDKDYAKSIEEDISHDLTEGIKNFLDGDRSPRWVEKFGVQCEKPISPHGETGRSRPRLDICIRSGERPLCPTFVFEAKRLYQGTESNDYFGNEGIQRFWNGIGYPLNVFYEAGMLGYVQNKDCVHWSNLLQEQFEKRRSKLSASQCSKWKQDVPIKELQYSYRTIHKPNDREEEISIFHILLSFC